MSSFPKTIIEDRLGITFSDSALLEQCFIDRSAVAEDAPNNSGLAWVGDAVLLLLVRDHLIHKGLYLQQKAGTLADALVSNALLSRLLADLGAVEWCRQGPARGGLWKQMALPKYQATVFEALLGALYQEQGLPAAKAFLDRVMLGIENIEERARQDPRARTLLAAELTRRGRQTVDYSRPSMRSDHGETVFVVDLRVDKKPKTFGIGKTPGQAKEDAALKYLRIIAPVLADTLKRPSS